MINFSQNTHAFWHIDGPDVAWCVNKIATTNTYVLLTDMDNEATMEFSV